jgi:hypothetical protein
MALLARSLDSSAPFDWRTARAAHPSVGTEYVGR